jgi:hypothetical protein
VGPFQVLGHTGNLSLRVVFIEFRYDNESFLWHPSYWPTCSFSYLTQPNSWQRVPITEKSGRVHTSAVSVAVLPQADEVGIGYLDKTF